MMRAGCFVLALLAWLRAAAPAQASIIEYLYVEPNAGGSSGGHAAIRFDGRVYDFHNHDLGTLRMARHDYDHFRYVYSVLENRPIHVARIETGSETHDALRDRFNERYFIQRRHFEILQSLRNDRALLAMMRDGATARDVAPAAPSALDAAFRGAGFFYGDAFGDAPAGARRPVAPGARALPHLRARIRDAYGAGFLGARSAALRAAMRSIEPPDPASTLPPVARGSYPGPLYTFSERYVDVGLKVLALDALRDARPLRPEARVTSADPELDLTAVERERLRAFAVALETRLVKLVQSSRPDWGFALLVGMARLEALAESLSTGRLVVLDAFSPEASVITFAGDRDRTAFVEELREEAHRDWQATRVRVFSTDSLRERDISALEDATNRFVEIQRGLQEDRPIRVQSDLLVPARSARPRGLPTPRAGPDALARASRAAREAEHVYAARLREAYGYNLLTRNCVSEIFDTIDSRFDAEQSRARLGGHVDPHSRFNFVPAASFRAVTRSYNVVAVGEVPSYRTRRLEDMYASENPLKVYLRESNTLTSTVYRKGESDSWFLFFTDDVVLPRPLYGAVNMLAGLGEMLAGTLRAPLDRGAMLQSGAKGITFSLPELAFVNLRKGTLTYARSRSPRTAVRFRHGGAD